LRANISPPVYKEPKATQFSQLVKQFEVLFLAQLTVAGRQVAHGEVVVAVKTLEGASACYFDGHFQRGALTGIVLVYGTAKVSIGSDIHFEFSLDSGRVLLRKHFA
jgi:hypothetical protein